LPVAERGGSGGRREIFAGEKNSKGCNTERRQEGISKHGPYAPFASSDPPFPRGGVPQVTDPANMPIWKGNCKLILLCRRTWVRFNRRLAPSAGKSSRSRRAVTAANRGLVHGNKPNEGLLNRVEAVMRAFDPCLSCSTHADGWLGLEIELLSTPFHQYPLVFREDRSLTAAAQIRAARVSKRSGHT